CAWPTVWTTSSICSRSFFPRRMVETHFPWRTGARIDIPASSTRHLGGLDRPVGPARPGEPAGSVGPDGSAARHPHDGPVEADGAGGAEELHIAEGEDPPVGGYQAAHCPC